MRSRANEGSRAGIGVQPATPSLSRLATVLEALFGLLFVDLALNFAGYRWLRRRIRGYRRRPTSGSSAEEQRALVVAALDAAGVWYPREAMCLQRSAVLTWLLRRRGVQADMVIGCRHTPFYAHAWVESGGVVVGDRQAVTALYPELERV